MPIVTVSGLEETNPNLKWLRTHLKETLAHIPELDIGPEKVTVRFLREVQPVPGQIVVHIDMLKTKKRTAKVRQQTSQKVADLVAGIVPDYKLIFAISDFIPGKASGTVVMRKG